MIGGHHYNLPNLSFRWAEYTCSFEVKHNSFCLAWGALDTVGNYYQVSLVVPLQPSLILLYPFPTQHE